MRSGLPGLCVVLALLLAGRAAHASCSGPSGRVLWTYPADGAVDVPTNTRLLVTDDSAGRPKLNGTQLTPDQDGTFDLGELAPNTTYRVTWDPMRENTEQHAISFTTGAGPSLGSAPASPEPLDVVRLSPSYYPHCPLLGFQGCFDTGAPLRVGFEPVEDALAWLVEIPSCDGTVRHMVWPAECGPPAVEAYDGRICASLRATDGVHASESTQMICSVPPPAPNGSTPALDSSCGAITFPPSGALLLPSKDDVRCSSDGTSDCINPPRTMDPPSGEGCSLGPGGHRSGAGWLALALAGCARVRRRRQRRSS